MSKLRCLHEMRITICPQNLAKIGTFAKISMWTRDRHKLSNIWADWSHFVTNCISYSEIYSGRLNIAGPISPTLPKSPKNPTQFSAWFLPVLILPINPTSLKLCGRLRFLLQITNKRHEWWHFLRFNFPNLSFWIFIRLRLVKYGVLEFHSDLF
jgi:hypothetical protein